MKTEQQIREEIDLMNQRMKNGIITRKEYNLVVNALMWILKDNEE